MTDPAAARTEMVPWHVAKRTFDVVFAIGILTLALPLLAIIVVLIQLDSHGVGARPALEYELDHYAGAHFERCLVRPGITGPWQMPGRSTLASRRCLIQSSPTPTASGCR